MLIMCLNPILIKNVNYGNKSKLAYISDSSAQYIPVPCGRCSVCLALKQQYIVQRVQMEALNHDLYFGTLTYNNDSLPIHCVGDFSLPYVDISDWQNMIKMIRKHENFPPFKYMMVTEYGGRRHRPHIHFILSFPKNHKHTLADRISFQQRIYPIFLKYWRRNYGSTRTPVWKPLCTYKRTLKSYNYDLHYLDPYSSKGGLDDVAFYASKYCLKYDKWLDKLKSKLYFNLSDEEFPDTWDKLRPRKLLSKGFGSPLDPDVTAHVLKGIHFAINDPTALFPYFISPVNGATFPLSPYYSKKYLSLEGLQIFNSRKPSLTDYDMMLDSTPELSLSEIERKETRFSHVTDLLESRHTYFDDDQSLIPKMPDYGKTNETPLMDSVFADYWQDFDFDNDCF